MHQGDALAILETLPTGSVDAILTDPPYCSGAAGLAGKQAHPAGKYGQSLSAFNFPLLLGDGKDQRSFTHWSALWLAQCWRMAREDGLLMVFSDWRQLPSITDAVQAAGWHWLGLVVWEKPNGRPQKGRFRSQCEYVVWGTKPMGLIKDLLAITRPGATILDPFLGAGTTAMAALETGRNCIGIELSPEYAKIAAERAAALI